MLCTHLPALGLENLDLSVRVSNQCPCLTATELNGDDKSHVQLELASEAGGAALPDPIQSG